MKDDFVASGRSVSDMKAHFGTDNIVVKFFGLQMFSQACRDSVRSLRQVGMCLSLTVREDHSLLFQYYPQMELPKFISNLKIYSSRRLVK